MKKKRGIITAIIICISITAIIVIPLMHDRHQALKTIKGILDRSLSINYKHVSTDVVSLQNFGRGKIVYTFKDENDVYFNVYYSHVRFYDSLFEPERLYICNYNQIIFSHYLEKIENAFLEHLNSDEFSLKTGDSARIRSNEIGKLYDFRTYGYDINISDGDLQTAKNRITAAVEAAVKVAPDWQYVTRALYDDNFHDFDRAVRQFSYSGFPGIQFYFHGAFIGRAHFNPDDATYFDVADGEAAIYFIEDWAMESNLKEKGLTPPF